MRLIRYGALGLLLLAATACRQDRETETQRAREDKESPAFKTGEAAHRIAGEAEKAAEEAAHKLREGARKAREGWKEQEKIDRDKKLQKDR